MEKVVYSFCFANSIRTAVLNTKKSQPPGCGFPIEQVRARCTLDEGWKEIPSNLPPISTGSENELHR